MKIRDVDSRFVEVPMEILTSYSEVNSEIFRDWLQLRDCKAGSLFSSKDELRFNQRHIGKGDIVMIISATFTVVKAQKVWAEFIFLHEDHVHTIEIPVTNWQAWFTPLKNEA